MFDVLLFVGSKYLGFQVCLLMSVVCLTNAFAVYFRRCTRTGMLLLSLSEELKGQVSRLLLLQLIPQGWAAGRLTSRTGDNLKLTSTLTNHLLRGVVYPDCDFIWFLLIGFLTDLLCHHFWHWRTLKVWTLEKWTRWVQFTAYEE